MLLSIMATMIMWGIMAQNMPECVVMLLLTVKRQTHAGMPVRRELSEALVDIWNFEIGCSEDACA